MPLHNYRCPACGATVEEYRSIQEGGNARLPECGECTADGFDMVYMQWCVPVVAMDAKEPGQRFTVMRDVYDRNPESGQVERFQRAEVIDSTHTMRRIEQDSEQRFRNGEGEPLRFRALSQDRSNLDQGCFGTSGQIGAQAYDSGKAPQKKDNIAVTRHGTTKPKVTVARHGGSSPLKG